MGALRLFLALEVAFDHARVFVLRPAKLDMGVVYALGLNAGYSVMFFYMISGFLISFVLRHKYDASPGGTRAFYKSRFIRIFSLYWPVACIALIFVHESRANFLGNSLVGKFTNLFLLGIDWNAAFSHYPAINYDAGITYLFQAWTLGAELVFYLCAPFLLRSRFLALLVTGMSVAVRAVMVGKYGFSASWTYHFLPSTILFFMLGHMAESLSEQFQLLKSPLLGVLGVSVCVVSLMFPNYTYWDTPRFWLATVSMGLALPGLFAGTKDNKFLNLLGALSFPVYLVHLLIMHSLDVTGYTKAVLDHFGTSQRSAHILMGSVLALSVAAAFAAHRLIELPMASFLRKFSRLGRTPKRAA